ncbi:MAG: metallophosphoesterase [Kiritimatiellae bacterium]|nr:metallophosphoesterase [Kiritimatiellia bacterium]
MDQSRREFLTNTAWKGAAAMAAAGAAKCGMGMLPSEQAAYDRYNALTIPRPDGILDGEPVLQVPAPDSMGVAFAVTALANGFVELADNAQMKGSVRFMAEGMPQAGIDDRVLQVRMTGLKSGTRYWYRAGAAKLEHPVGYWTKPSEIVWSAVHTFVTPGENAPSHFGMMCDTHAHFEQMGKITKKYRELGVPLMVWNGDIPRSLTNNREDFVRHYLVPPHNAGYAADTPIILNRGNHDYRGTAVKRLGEVMMPRLPTERSARDFALDRNFAFRMGEVALIGLDTGEDKPDHHPANGGLSRFTPFRIAQTEWLRDQFKRPEIARAPYVVAFVHIPLIELWPGANPGTLLEDYAVWQKECADLWGPILTENKAQLVLAGHIHRYRYDAATPTRSWAEIVGGGRGDRTFQTLVEGKVENGRLVIRVYNTDAGTVVGEHVFAPRA